MSVDALHARDIELLVCAGEVRFAGTLGAWVSGPVPPVSRPKNWIAIAACPARGRSCPAPFKIMTED